MTRSSRRIANVSGILACALVGATGCYRYAPTRFGDVTPGTGVSARVTPEASQRIAPLLGTTSARDLRGTLISRGEDTLIVEVPAAGVPDPQTFGRVLSQRISLTKADVIELQVRTLDRWKTGAVVGASAAIVVAALIKVMRGDPALDKTPGGGGTESISPVLQRVP